MIGNKRVLELAEPVELMFADCQSMLLVRIAEQLAKGKTLDTQAWELARLSELGAVTRDGAAIIAKYTGAAPDAIYDALVAAARESIEADEALYKIATKRGLLSPSGVDVDERVQLVVRDYAAQAKDKLNLVNTVMLDSMQNRYRQAIAGIVDAEEKALIESLASVTNAEALAGKMQVTQKALNTAAGSVNLAVETRTKAVRRAIADLAKHGITGFVDRGGHHWTPEAYVNMDVRTTVHNTAIQAQKTRSADYGVVTFQVSTKAAARELCAPYQGWICSWDDSGGTVQDLHGKTYEVHPISSTSYGEPAGLFGINCGHTANTFVSGMSLARYAPLTPEQETENARAYALSQQQRGLERAIRVKKTEAAMYNAAGLKDDFDVAALEVKRTNEAYRAFCKSNDLQPRMDRTQVFGYNRQVSGKALEATRPYKTSDGLTVTKTIHALNRAAQRGVSNAEIADALAHPLDITPIKYNAQGLPSRGYVGEKATVYVNPDNGNITSTHKTRSKLAQKLKGGS